MMKKAIVLGSSRGIGKAISLSLKAIGYNVIATSKKDLDTSDLQSVKKFIEKHEYTDVIVLNTGGPPAKDFFDISEEEWKTYHNQLFLSFCIILQNLKINDGGYIFLISSDIIKEPNPNLILSSTYRLAFSSVLKVLSKEYARRNISCINIAPGAINTDRVHQLGLNVVEIENSLPMRRMGKPEEIGDFVGSIVEKNIKYLSGVIINFDGANSNYLF